MLKLIKWLKSYILIYFYYNSDKTYAIDKTKLIESIDHSIRVLHIAPTWLLFLKELKRDVKFLPFSSFLRWPTIRKTMAFEGLPKYIYDEIIKDNFFKNYVIEDSFGNPKKSNHNVKTSDNYLHHVESLRQIMQYNKYKTITSVFEFGGGYGSMCRILKKIYPNINYLIYDLPVFKEVQRIFLKNVLDSTRDIYWVEDLILNKKADLFISTWALSEVPLKLRVEILGNISCNNYLIAFQDKFDDIDNIDFFIKFGEEISNTHDFFIKDISYLPGNKYFIAKNK